jgi:hypothetical protein
VYNIDLNILTGGVDSVLGCLYYLDMISVADISEIHAASIFMVEASRVCECL